MIKRNPRRSMFTDKALQVAADSNARRGMLLLALMSLVEDQEAHVAERQIHFAQTPNVSHAIRMLVFRMLGMGGQYAESVKCILRSRPAIFALFPTLAVAGEPSSGTTEIHDLEMRRRGPTLYEVMVCMASDGGSADGLDGDYRAWVEDHASPELVSRAEAKLRQNKDLVLSLR